MSSKSGQPHWLAGPCSQRLRCARCVRSRPGSSILKPAGSVRGARTVTIFVATLRTPEPGSEIGFNSGQSQTLRFARYVISIPPARQTDTIEWPGNPPDPATDFVTIKAGRLSEAEFRSGITGEVEGGRSIRLFVHGYNNSFQETVYRLAQITADAHDNRVAVLFAWPSRESHLVIAWTERRQRTRRTALRKQSKFSPSGRARGS